MGRIHESLDTAPDLKHVPWKGFDIYEGLSEPTDNAKHRRQNIDAAHFLFVSFSYPHGK